MLTVKMEQLGVRTGLDLRERPLEFLTQHFDESGLVVLAELPSRSPVDLLDQLGHRKFSCSINHHEQVQPAIIGLHLGNDDVKEADRVTLEMLALGFVTLDIGQSGYAVPLEAPTQH